MNEHRTNGYAKRAGQAVAQAAGDVLEEVAALAGLQVQLGLADFREARARMIRGVVTAAAALAVILGSLPVMLAGVALLLAEQAGWSLWAALLASGGVTALVGAIALGWALRSLQRSMQVFGRSQEQFRENVQQIRAALRRRDHPAAKSASTAGEAPAAGPFDR